MKQLVAYFALFLICESASSQLPAPRLKYTPTDVRTSPVDIFPLSVGTRYRYQYRNASSVWGIASRSSVVDSGTAECTVTAGSVINDTTIGWLVRESVDVLRRTYPNYGHDTTFAARDSSTNVLYESTTGNHLLRSSSTIWRFPAMVNTPVYRFSDSSGGMIARKTADCYIVANTNYDTLWFSRDSGLFRRSESYCHGDDEGGADGWMFVNLLSVIIASVQQPSAVPARTALFQNYPNPFNPATNIKFQIPDSRFQNVVTLKVFDVLGREVATLVNGVKPPGEYSVRFDAAGLASGVYFYRLQANDFIATRKLIVVR